MNLRVIGILFTAIVLFGGCETASTKSSPEYRRVTFDEFFAKQVVSLPLSFEIPAQYVHATGLTVPSTYSYWMKRDEIAKAARTQDLPGKTGFVYGKLSLDVGFDQTRGRFTIEDDFESKAAQSGLEILSRRKLEIKGHAILDYMTRARNGNIVCSLYIATRIETNALYIAYRPPGNDLTHAKEVWNRMVGSVQ
ncbi:MAG: hypothetical protein HZA93_05235 [Verrucomicrobia bacterium]|nr:hypothetical protein [Verrucomicrobiota bacterium]